MYAHIQSAKHRMKSLIYAVGALVSGCCKIVCVLGATEHQTIDW